VVLSIGKPKPSEVRDDLDTVKRHVEGWRRVNIGEVVWESATYRSTAEPVSVPAQWKLRQPSEWIAACNDPTIKNEFVALSSLVGKTEARFHSLLVRRRSLWRDKPLNEVLQAADLAMRLEPGCAKGAPLRTLSLAGIDTKFFDRNTRLVSSLLDMRFDDEVSKIGLELFLGALAETDHWLLVVDLDGGLLSFPRQRVASTELRGTVLPGSQVLIVENETCQHLLPRLSDTIAILGAGLDARWMAAENFVDKRVAYWGDIDTWGLQCLARARAKIGDLHALLMNVEVFESHLGAAVVEPVVAGSETPTELTTEEKRLYHRLLGQDKGRLEQEFLPNSLIHSALEGWSDS